MCSPILLKSLLVQKSLANLCITHDTINKQDILIFVVYSSLFTFTLPSILQLHYNNNDSNNSNKMGIRFEHLAKTSRNKFEVDCLIVKKVI